jgi:hypothetical protein
MKLSYKVTAAEPEHTRDAGPRRTSQSGASNSMASQLKAPSLLDSFLGPQFFCQRQGIGPSAGKDNLQDTNVRGTTYGRAVLKASAHTVLFSKTPPFLQQTGAWWTHVFDSSKQVGYVIAVARSIGKFASKPCLRVKVEYFQKLQLRICINSLGITSKLQEKCSYIRTYIRIYIYIYIIKGAAHAIIYNL